VLIYCSPDPAVMGTGNYIAAWRAHQESNSFPTGTQSWANAFYTYWPDDIGPFNASWQSFVTDYPSGVPVLASPKGRPDTPTGATALHNFCSQIPVSWRSEFIMAYWQEPGNNFGGGGQPTIAEYRDRVAAMADIVRGYDLKNAVHVEEWDINPFNNAAGSNQSERFAHLAQFVQGIEDKIDVVSWSLYPAAGNSLVPGLQRMEAWMDEYMPDCEWRVTATGTPVAVNSPLGSAERIERANLVREAGDHIVARTLATNRGPHSFGWFHFSDFGGNNRDNLATTDQLLYDALQYVAGLEVSGGGEPPTSNGFVDATQASVIGAGTMNIIVPSNVMNGDVALLFIDSMNNVSDATVAGWASLGRAVGAENIASRLLVRQLQASDSNTEVVITLSQSDIRYSAQMVVYRGVNSEGIVSQWSLQGGSTSTLTPEVQSSSGAILVEHVVERANPVGTNFTPPAEIVERLDSGPAFDGVSVRAATGDKSITESGTVGGNTWNSTITTNHRAAWTVVLSGSTNGREWLVRQGGTWLSRPVYKREANQWSAQ